MTHKNTALSGYSAKGGYDDHVHLVDAADDALLDPSPYRTRCGQLVLEVYNTHRAITCPACAASREPA